MLRGIFTTYLLELLLWLCTNPFPTCSLKQHQASVQPACSGSHHHSERPCKLTQDTRLHNSAGRSMRDSGIVCQEDRTKNWLFEQSDSKSSTYSDNNCTSANSLNKQMVCRSCCNYSKYSDSNCTSASTSNKQTVLRSSGDTSNNTDSLCYSSYKQMV